MPSSDPISRACSCHSGCSVVGFLSKRFFPLLTVARSHSAPSLHGRYPLPRYYGLSDSRDFHFAGLPGSSAYRSSRAAPSHPGEPDGCSPASPPSVTGFIRFGRLATLTLCNEAEPGLLSLRLAVSPHKASCRGLLQFHTLARLSW